jgi:hypothetical protein
LENVRISHESRVQIIRLYTRLVVLLSVAPDRPHALPRIKDNKTISVADEDSPEEYRGQQSILLGC